MLLAGVGRLGVVVVHRKCGELAGLCGPAVATAPVTSDIPTHWTADENIAWKTAVPGIGDASPIVWQDRVFIVSCLEESQERALLSFDRVSGKLLWQQVVRRPAGREASAQ